MNVLRSSAVLTWLAAIGLLALLATHAHRTHLALGAPATATGWSLLALLVALAAFNTRKRLSMLPLGSASTWLRLHVVGGILAVPLFWLHAGISWPTGLYEQALALLFYGISLNGLLGYCLQRLYPGRLTRTGLEIIYERIPGEIAQLRERAEAVILDCTKETASDTLATHYVQNLQWFFARPRFALSHTFGGQRGQHWIQLQCTTVQRYLSSTERGYLSQLAELAELKNKIDLHYALQGIMKGWLLIHIPLAVALMVLTVWHVLLVHVYLL